MCFDHIKRILLQPERTIHWKISNRKHDVPCAKQRKYRCSFFITDVWVTFNATGLKYSFFEPNIHSAHQNLLHAFIRGRPSGINKFDSNENIFTFKQVIISKVFQHLQLLPEESIQNILQICGRNVVQYHVGLRVAVIGNFVSYDVHVWSNFRFLEIPTKCAINLRFCMEIGKCASDALHL